KFSRREVFKLRKLFLLILALGLLSSSAAWASTTYSATEAEKHAIVETGTATYSDIIVTKTGDGSDSNKSEYYDWYGRNAAILASGDSAKITINTAKITSDATYGSAVFAYGGEIDITDAEITTSKKNSGGIMVTGGGTIKATDLTITTEAGSSAAIRSDKGGGTISVNGGTYTANGTGSPAIYSTADITVEDATLNSGVAQGVVIEGGNSVTLSNTTMNANHTTKNGQDSTYQAVLIYQSGSGDASEGSSSFAMDGGSIVNKQGDIFCVTNTTCTITLTDVEITNNDTTGNFLRAEGQNWGSSSNGGKVTLNASNQTISGNIVVASDSSLTMTLKDSSTFSGAINPSSSSSSSSSSSIKTAADTGTVNITVEEGSTLTLTGNSTISSLTLASEDDVDYGTYSLSIDGTEYNSSNPAPVGTTGDSSTNNNTDDTTNDENENNNPGGNGDGDNGGNGNGNGNNNSDTENDDTTTTTTNPGSSSSGCNFGGFGLALSALVALVMKKK
ncbi:MAG: hypothetical protein IJ597_06805, partial [Synergistaceae bacterium]|nr:hypothetical protein [Synergistaceae bacterium]